MMLNIFVFICQVYVFFLVSKKTINVLELDFSSVTLLGGINVSIHDITHHV